MVTSVVFCLLMIIALVTKHVIRLRKGSSLQHFDYFLFCGALLMVIQTVCVTLAVSRGLGKHVAQVQGRADIEKLLYAASLLAVASLACTKTSICLLISQINNYGRLRTATRLVIGIVLGSVLSSALGTAFRCSLPVPWQAASPSACPGARPVYLYNGIVSIITDVQICALSVAMVWNIKSDVKKKATVICLFNSRLLCPITTIPSLMHTEFLYQSSDFTWLAVHPVVWLQISYNLAVITACIPTMKNVFDSMSGNFSAEIDAPYQLKSVKGGRSMRLQPSTLDQEPSQAHFGSGSHDESLKLHTAVPSQAACYATDRGRRTSARVRKDDESGSESVQNLTDGVVLVTEEVNVQFEDDRPSSNLGSYNSWDSTNQRITLTK